MVFIRVIEEMSAVQKRRIKINSAGRNPYLEKLAEYSTEKIKGTLVSVDCLLSLLHPSYINLDILVNQSLTELF